MKIATWNVNSINVRLPHLLPWLEAQQPDIVALQETKIDDARFPLAQIEAAGYQAIISGQKTYNGVAILTKSAATDVVTDYPNFEDHQRRILAVTISDIRVINLYVPNGSEVGSEKFMYKLEWLKHLYSYLQEQVKQYERVVILGDFNIAPTALDVHDPALWEGSVLFNPEVRAVFEQLLQLGFIDLFRAHHTEAQYSWWDYRQAAFRRNIGLRIDHIMATQPLAQVCTAVEINKEIRKLERPSDHAPVIATFSTP
jgi:exodeoxyribonuclease-3